MVQFHRSTDLAPNEKPPIRWFGVTIGRISTVAAIWIVSFPNIYLSVRCLGDRIRFRVNGSGQMSMYRQKARVVGLMERRVAEL